MVQSILFHIRVVSFVSVIVTCYRCNTFSPSLLHRHAYLLQSVSVRHSFSSLISISLQNQSKASLISLHECQMTSSNNYNMRIALLALMHLLLISSALVHASIFQILIQIHQPQHAKTSLDGLRIKLNLKLSQSVTTFSIGSILLFQTLKI